MKLLDSNRNEVFSSKIRLDGEGQVVADVAVGGGMSFETFPVGLSMQKVDDGLEVAVNIPNSGLDPFYAVLEYSDTKTLRALPGKGLVSFALKAFR